MIIVEGIFDSYEEWIARTNEDVVMRNYGVQTEHFVKLMYEAIRCSDWQEVCRCRQQLSNIQSFAEYLIFMESDH